MPKENGAVILRIWHNDHMLVTRTGDQELL